MSATTPTTKPTTSSVNATTHADVLPAKRASVFSRRTPGDHPPLETAGEY
ncbi:hypothetical protein [Haloarcula regularis]|nr:hypothetical protein [Halomicroarcula sp. SYNS111]